MKWKWILLIVEALVINRDAGFVREGQGVIVKLEAYPFTRYGHLEGVVEQISPDAVADEKRGLVFPVRVRLTKSSLRGIEGALLASGANDTVAAGGGRVVGGPVSFHVEARDGAGRAILTPGMAAQSAEMKKFLLNNLYRLGQR